MGPIAHSAGSAVGVEPELLVFGIVTVFLAFLLRPSQTGNARAAVIALVIGISLLLGSFTIPRL